MADKGSASNLPLRMGIAIYVLFVANAVACVGAVPQGLNENQFTQYSSVELNSHLYHLDSQWASRGPGQPWTVFIMWDCDNIGLMCRDIHEEEQPNDGVEYGNTKASLIVDSESIALNINGKTVYIYHP